MNRNNEQIKETIAEIRRSAEEAGANILIDDGNFYEHRQHCLWYGGLLAEISINNTVIRLEANGDVRATLYDSSNNILEQTHDKANAGSFFN